MQGKAPGVREPMSTAVCIISLCFGLWLVCFIFSRAHILHVAYNTIIQAREDESWLLQQCEQHEFYHNMKQHSALCDELAGKSKNVAVFDAMQHVVDNTYLCGYTPCYLMLEAVSAWMLGRGFFLTLALAVLVLFSPSLFMPFWRRNMNHMADRRMHQLYNTPYGTPHYQHSHPRLDTDYGSAQLMG